MEYRPHIVVAARNIPPEDEVRFLKWYDEVYAPTYVKMPGYAGIDRYQIVKKTLQYPDSVSLHHYKNRNAVEESKKNPIRIDLQKDHNITFYREVWVWHDVYVLTGSFRHDSSSPDSTIVENAPFVHLEGYRVPPIDQGKYDQWFANWASRIYIPSIMKSPGLKAYNCFKLSDFSMRFAGRNYLQAEIPPYVSILYFENIESFESYEGSPEYAWFKRSMEVELPGTVTKIWNVQYQLRKSFRK